MEHDIEITTKSAAQANAEQSSGCCGGGCCGQADASDAAPAPSKTSATVQVDGMTCEHCVASVTEELREVPGVRGVRVDLVAGGRSTVTIDTDGPLDPEAVRTAIADAGYSLA